MKFSSAFSRCALVALLSAGAVARAQSFNLTDLGAGTAADINNSGHVVGTTAAHKAFFYDGLAIQIVPVDVLDVGNPFTGELDPVFADTSDGVAINDSDLVLANGSSSFVGRTGSNLYQAQTGTQKYPFIYTYFPLALNNSDRVVGTIALGNYGDFSVGIVDLNPALAYNDPARLLYGPYFMGYSRINAVNAANVAVGSAAAQYGTSSGTLHPLPNLIRACIFGTNGVQYIDPRDPGTVAVDPNGPTSHLSDAYGINADGHIVGDMNLKRSSAARHAFRYTGTNSGLEDLGTLGGVSSSAYDLNSSDQVVGTSKIASGEAHAFVWKNGVMTDLNTLLPAGSGWVLQNARAINNRGEIVGSGVLGGVVHAFLLSPSALPPTLTIVVPPAGATLAAGQSYTLSVTAQGGEPLSYQWQHAGTNLPGATRSSYVIASAKPADAGGYLVTVQNTGGNTATAGADLIVRELRLTTKDYLGLTVAGSVGATYAIECKSSATDSTWTPLTTLTLANSTEVYVDQDSPGHPQRVYRAVLQP